MALATCFGNFWYAYEAYRLAHKEKHQDVTAQPYGAGAGAVFGWLFLIIGTVFWDTGDAVLAACFLEGVGTIIGAFFGNPFPTTVYYGHPSWKEVGARSGYSILNGITYLVLELTGAVGMISAVIPYQVVMSMLLFVGLVVGAQAFNECNNKHGVAILFGFLPLIAQYLETAVSESLAAMGGNMASVGVEAFSSSFPIRGVLALSQGAFLSSLLLTAIIACVIDAKFKQTGYCAMFSAACAFMGLIHAPIMQWMAPSGAPFAVVYMTVALSCFYVEWKKEMLIDPAHLDLSSVDSVDNEQATA